MKNEQSIRISSVRVSGDEIGNNRITFIFDTLTKISIQVLFEIYVIFN
jgi:hypothetical protein